MATEPFPYPIVGPVDIDAQHIGLCRNAGGGEEVIDGLGGHARAYGGDTGSVIFGLQSGGPARVAFDEQAGPPEDVGEQRRVVFAAVTRPELHEVALAFAGSSHEFEQDPVFAVLRERSELERRQRSVVRDIWAISPMTAREL
jgi:hypothetical protein